MHHADRVREVHRACIGTNGIRDGMAGGLVSARGLEGSLELATAMLELLFCIRC